MRIYIHRRLLLGLIVAFIVIATMGIASYLFFIEFIETARWSSHARSVLYKVEEGRSLFHEVENAELNTLLDSNYNQRLDAILAAFNKNLNELDSLVQDNPDQQKKIGELRDVVAVGFRHMDSDGSTPFSADPKKLTMLSEEVMNRFSVIKNGENVLIKERSIKASNRFTQFGIAIVGLIVSTLVLLGILTYGINSTLRARSQTEEMLREAEKKATKVNEELESFTYSVSHDLRAPLRSIDGYAQILKEDFSPKLDDDGIRIIGVIINNAKRMGQLIDDLLDFSRVGRKEVMRSTIDMNEFVKPILDELLEHEKGRQISVDLRPMGQANVDINLFRQVWVNLLSNAIKYSRNREVAHIEIGRVNLNGEATYYVKDNGAGFDMKYVGKLFGVFQRLHKPSEFEGTGVGLALVKRIVDRHKGRIWADSAVDQGSTFYFCISKS